MSGCVLSLCETYTYCRRSLSYRSKGYDLLIAMEAATWIMTQGALMTKQPKPDADVPVGYEALLVAIGARIREYREQAHIRQSQLGAAINSGQSHVYLIEAGRVNLTLKTLMKLANALGVKPADLVNETRISDVVDQNTFKQLVSLLKLLKSDLRIIDERIDQAGQILSPETNIEQLAEDSKN